VTVAAAKAGHDEGFIWLEKCYGERLALVLHSVFPLIERQRADGTTDASLARLRMHFIAAAEIEVWKRSLDGSAIGPR
jgi:hypothetical protein